MKFGEILKEIRIKHGDSLRGLGEKIDNNFSYIDKVEKGVTPISRNLFEKLLKTYPLDKKRLMKAYCDELLPDDVKDYIMPKEQKENFLGDLFELVKLMDKEQQKIIIFNIIERLEYLSLKDGKFELIKDILEQAKEKTEKL
jgi:transcriptional regulator with XRE-family HTH domain